MLPSIHKAIRLQDYSKGLTNIPCRHALRASFLLSQCNTIRFLCKEFSGMTPRNPQEPKQTFRRRDFSRHLKTCLSFMIPFCSVSFSTVSLLLNRLWINQPDDTVSGLPEMHDTDQIFPAIRYSEADSSHPADGTRNHVHDQAPFRPDIA